MRLYKLGDIVKTYIYSFVDDKTFAKLKYKEGTGRILELNKPKTFNEKLLWLKINNRDPLLTICSDKVKVREYVTEKGYDDILVPIIGHYDNINDIDFNKIPDNSFIKTNHGSGTNLQWNKNLKIKRVKRIFTQALHQNYYWQSREWNYMNIKPQIIIERNLKELNSGKDIIDYRFLCFDGKVKLVFVDIETAANDGSHNPYAKRNVYERDFKYLNAKVVRENFKKDIIKKPKNYNTMLTIAENLSEPFVFCRVDLYNFYGEIYFGELTFYPGGATQIIEPQTLEEEMGSYIDLTSRKIIRKVD